MGTLDIRSKFLVNNGIFALSKCSSKISMFWRQMQKQVGLYQRGNHRVPLWKNKMNEFYTFWSVSVHTGEI